MCEQKDLWDQDFEEEIPDDELLSQSNTSFSFSRDNKRRRFYSYQEMMDKILSLQKENKTLYDSLQYFKLELRNSEKKENERFIHWQKSMIEVNEKYENKIKELTNANEQSVNYNAGIQINEDDYLFVLKLTPPLITLANMDNIKFFPNDIINESQAYFKQLTIPTKQSFLNNFPQINYHLIRLIDCHLIYFIKFIYMDLYVAKQPHEQSTFIDWWYHNASLPLGEPLDDIEKLGAIIKETDFLNRYMKILNAFYEILTILAHHERDKLKQFSIPIIYPSTLNIQPSTLENGDNDAQVNKELNYTRCKNTTDIDGEIQIHTNKIFTRLVLILYICSEVKEKSLSIHHFLFPLTLNILNLFWYSDERPCELKVSIKHLSTIFLYGVEKNPIYYPQIMEFLCNLIDYKYPFIGAQCKKFNKDNTLATLLDKSWHKKHKETCFMRQFFDKTSKAFMSPPTKKEEIISKDPEKMIYKIAFSLNFLIALARENVLPQLFTRDCVYQCNFKFFFWISEIFTYMNDTMFPFYYNYVEASVAGPLFGHKILEFISPNDEPPKNEYGPETSTHKLSHICFYVILHSLQLLRYVANPIIRGGTALPRNSPNLSKNKNSKKRSTPAQETPERIDITENGIDEHTKTTKTHTHLTNGHEDNKSFDKMPEDVTLNDQHNMLQDTMFNNLSSPLQHKYCSRASYCTLVTQLLKLNDKYFPDKVNHKYYRELVFDILEPIMTDDEADAFIDQS